MTAWDWWENKLAGKPVQMNDSNPQAGFYRQPRKAFYGARKTFLPVAYWPGENGHLNCRVDDKDVSWQRGEEIWKTVGNHPVTHEAYHNKCEPIEPDGSPNPNYTGLWPDEHELVPMGLGHNFPPEDIDWDEIAEIGSIDPNDTELLKSLQDRIEDLSREANKRIEGPPIADQDEANRVANLADALQQFHKIADGTRAREKKPHDDAAKSIQQKWAPWLLKTETYRNLKYKLLTPWLNLLKKKAAEAAEAAAAAGQLVPADTRRPSAGTRGRKMSLKSTKRAEIIDFDKCLEHFKDSPDLRDCVQELANRAVRHDFKVPGTKVIVEEQAV